MTEIVYTSNYRTQFELRTAYEKVGHKKKKNNWDASLLIDENLFLYWGCRRLMVDDDGEAVGCAWHRVGYAGELDWPPLRPEEEVWEYLLQKHPFPVGDKAEFIAKKFGKTVEEYHRYQLSMHYLSSSHIGNSKMNPSDVNFDPGVLDWGATARELARFIESSKPPKLNAEQRVMEQGARLYELRSQAENTEESLQRLVRNAARDNGQAGMEDFKDSVASWTGESRSVINSWLDSSGCCEGEVPK